MFRRYFGDDVTLRQATLAILVPLTCFYSVVNLLVHFMGGGSFLQTTALTNVVMAAGPGLVWLQRRSRAGNGLGIALVILFGTINTFLLTGMWVQAMPEVFDTPWYYLTGICGIVFDAIIPSQPQGDRP